MAPQEDEEDEDGDFSFPTTTASPPRFIGSPRLWRSSSCSLCLQETKETNERQTTSDDQKKISFLSYIQSKDGNENMDVIWEDLNYEEEICSVRRNSDSLSFNIDREMPEWGGKRGGLVKLGCVQSSLRLGNSGGDGGGGGGKRRVLVNLLKKLFLLHDTSRHWTVKN